jgi:hypothetical protein
MKKLQDKESECDLTACKEAVKLHEELEVDILATNSVSITSWCQVEKFVRTSWERNGAMNARGGP